MARPRLLFVDDEVGTRKLVEQYLQLSKSNYEIVFAHSGKEAMKLLQDSQPFDLLLTDIKMPEMDGWELIDFSQSHYNLKTIIISAFGTVENFQRAFEEQVADFFIKPFNFEKLFQSVKKIVDFSQPSSRKIEKVTANTGFDKKLTYNTVARLARELKPFQQVKLISDLLKNFDLEQLEAFQLEIPSLKEHLLAKQEERERLLQKDAERIARGYSPISLIADSWIEERWQVENSVSGEEKKYLYYMLRWKEGKKLKAKTLKRDELADPEIRAMVEQKLGKPLDHSYDR